MNNQKVERAIANQNLEVWRALNRIYKSETPDKQLIRSSLQKDSFPAVAGTLWEASRARQARYSGSEIPGKKWIRRKRSKRQSRSGLGRMINRLFRLRRK